MAAVVDGCSSRTRCDGVWIAAVVIDEVSDGVVADLDEFTIG